ncbi:outer membrane protein assembly factor BamA [Pelagibacteraceae bacterium]|nr:outer membrane protein assembly factor BamA [Pelagibacteraceae bacterium]
MLKYLTLIYLLLLNSLFAEVIKKIEINGNERISEETIKVYGEVTLGKDYSAIDINNVLKNLYNTEFFEDIKLSLTNNILNIQVVEYRIINSIEIQGEKSKSVKAAILKSLELKEKGSYIDQKLENDLRSIKKAYAAIGYNFASVEVKKENFQNKRINLIYILDKGKKTNIRQISFTGDKKIKEKRLRDVIASEEKKFWKFLSKNTFLNSNNIELDKRLLVNYYKSLGYYDVQVLSSSAVVSKSNFTNLTYSINAGNRYTVNKISTNVSDVLNKNLFLPLEKDFSKVIGKYYSPFTVKKLLDAVDSLILDNDLQFIEHSVNEIIENDSIEIKINIYEGSKKLVERIIIKGNSVTDESVIRSELLLDEGDPFNSLKLDQSIAKLKSRNIFGEIKKTVTDGSIKGQKIIDIEVEEKPTGEISAGAGIGTNGASFAFNIRENNWLGRGIQVQTNVDVSKENFTGGISYSNPNYNYTGNTLTYFANNSSNDKPDSGFTNSITSFGVGTSFEQYRDIYLSPSVSYSYDNLKVDSSASDALKKQKGTFSDLSLSYGVSLDKRNRTYGPTDGYFSKFSQSLPIYADSPYLRNNYKLSSYHAFSENAIGAFKFYATGINGLSKENVRISKRVRLPSNSLRGFESGKVGPKDGTDYVGGNYAMASNFELNLPNLLPESTKTDIGLFLDFGNIWEVDYDSSIEDSNKIRSTAGFNTSWSSPVGPMSFIISQNISKASTDITESFSFKLGTTF